MGEGLRVGASRRLE